MAVFKASSPFLLSLLFGAALCAGWPALARDAAGQNLDFGSETWRGHVADFGEGARAGCRAFSHFGNGDRVTFMALARPDNPAVIEMWVGVAPASLDTDGPPAPTSIAPVLARAARAGRAGTAVRIWVDDAPEAGVRGVAADDLALAAVGPLTLPKAARFFRALREGKVLKLGIAGETRPYALRGAPEALNELVGCALRAHDGRTGPAEGLPASRPPPPPAPQPPPPADPPRIGPIGSGVVVTREGHVLTNQHVVEKCHGFAVRRVGDGELPARLVAQDAQNDLALLKAAGSFDAAAGVRVEPPRLGEAVVAYGFPLSGVLASSGNVTFGNVSALTGPRDDSRAIQITAPLQPGNSGGPVLDGAGLLVGVVRSRLAVGLAQNVNFALRGSLAATFLDAHRVEPALEQRRPDLGVTEVTAVAQRVTVQVICRQERP